MSFSLAAGLFSFGSLARLGASLVGAVPSRLFLRAALPLLVLAVLLAGEMSAGAQFLQRRKDQYPTDKGYMFVPAPYAIPGLGQGLTAIVAGANMFGTTTDIYGVLLTGDITGAVLGIEELPIIDRKLYFYLGYQAINKAQVTYYTKRGMDSDVNDYFLIDVSGVESIFPSLCLCLFDRRLSLTAGTWSQKVDIVGFRNPDLTVVEGVDGGHQESKATILGVELDFTDDYKDPRKGIRFNARNTSSPTTDLAAPEYTVQDLSLSFYVPMGKISTLAINMFRSDANVSRQGETDPEVLATDPTIGCPSYAACPAAVQASIDNAIAANTNGTSTGLGGDLRMRAYPGNRYQGAHTLYYSAEFRWNLSEESTPFDYWVWKDVRTNMQLAFFYETGSVSETRETLGDIFKSSYGVGFRMVTASGFVYRLDLSVGDEGTIPTIIFGYPFY